MTLIVIVTIVQTVSSTLIWLGLNVDIRALPGARPSRSRWIIVSGTDWRLNVA